MIAFITLKIVVLLVIHHKLKVKLVVLT